MGSESSFSCRYSGALRFLQDDDGETRTSEKSPLWPRFRGPRFGQMLRAQPRGHRSPCVMATTYAHRLGGSRRSDRRRGQV